VSTANVSQLAVDLVITSLALERVGVIDPTYFVPVAGGREDSEPGITTALERMSDRHFHFLEIK
jgi:proteasome assembly chaperone 2